MTPNETKPISLVPLPLPVSITPPSTDERRPLKDLLETVGKLLLGIAGLCYVTGLIVVSMHLRQYGLNSLVLSQLHYVMAGVWALLPIVLAMFLTMAAMNSVFDEEARIKRRAPRNEASTETNGERSSMPNIKIALGVAFLLLTMCFVLWMLLNLVGFAIRWSWLGLLLAGEIVALFFFAVGYSLSRPDCFKETTSVARIMTLSFFSLSLFFGYLIVFTKRSYQDIPWSTGGGGSSQVELVVAAEAKAQLESVGIKFLSGENRTDRLRLFLVTDKEYIIINGDGKAVSVPAGSVNSVIYEK